MNVLEGHPATWSAGPPASLTIGVLDGVHLGHRHLLQRLDEHLARTVLTFDPHPIEVLRPGTPARLITLIGERIELFGQEGVEVVGILDLNDIKDLTPEEFVRDVLAAKMNVAHVVVGEDFRFGRDRSGDVETLAQLGADLGFIVEPIDMVSDEHAVISSSRIRHLIEQGEVSTASRMLGSWYSLTNTVVHGDKRGRTIGFPTANLEPPPRKLIPAHGVYACWARLSGRSHQAAVNVGVRPTFDGHQLVVEAFILDFDEDIYDERLTLDFVEFLRPELRFPDIPSLVEHMHQDVERTRAILETTPAKYE